jgi:hypothetical protein
MALLTEKVRWFPQICPGGGIANGAWGNNFEEDGHGFEFGPKERYYVGKSGSNGIRDNSNGAQELGGQYRDYSRGSSANNNRACSGSGADMRTTVELEKTIRSLAPEKMLHTAMEVMVVPAATVTPVVEPRLGSLNIMAPETPTSFMLDFQKMMRASCIRKFVLAKAGKMVSEN